MKIATIALGNTYPNKNEIKGEGFWWHRKAKVWVKEWTHDDTGAQVDLLTEKIESMPGVKTLVVDLDATKEGNESWLVKEVEAFSETNVDEAPKVMGLKKGQEIEIKAWLAKSIGRKIDVDHVFMNLEIVDVHNESQYGYKVDFKFLSRVANSCHLCGTELTTDVSRACGIGPTCAKKIGAMRPTRDNAEQVLERLDEYAKEIGVIKNVWMSKRGIKAIDGEETGNE